MSMIGHPATPDILTVCSKGFIPKVYSALQKKYAFLRSS